MACHIVDLTNFYQSPLGEIAKDSVQNMIKEFWPSIPHDRVLGMGYPLPYFPLSDEKMDRLLVFMPMQQGVLPWPEDQPCLTCLVEEEYIPLPNESMDRIILIHSLEHSEHVRLFLREIWRILSPQGRLLVITPNRRGIWARFDNTPFGQGNPYTMTQLSTLLKETQFTPLQKKYGLYAFPSQSRFMLALSPVMEKFSRRMMPKFSGLLGIECTKQVYAIYPPCQRRFIPIPAFLGARSPRITGSN